jgi:hypothetical protein
MNCKPGQTAMVVRNVTGSPCDEAQLGAVITVIEVTHVNHTGPCWSYEGEPRYCPRSITGLCRIVAYTDANLKPLPDLGDEDEDTVPALPLEVGA